MTVSARHLLGLASFFLADVRDGLGPFLGVFLVAHGWGVDAIGVATLCGGLANLLASPAAGILSDITHHKRSVVAIACGVITLSTLGLYIGHTPCAVYLLLAASGAATALIPPTLSGITLGIFGQDKFAEQTGFNEACNHAGNFATAGTSGLIAWLWGLEGIFFLLGMMAVAAIICIFWIPPDAIDHQQARGLSANDASKAPSSVRKILKMPALLAIAAIMFLFHLANAAQLPLLSLRIATLTHGAISVAGPYAAFTIILAQAVMVPVAALAGRYTTLWGSHKLIFVALAALIVRSLIAAFWSNAFAVIPVQICDGVGAGILGVVIPVYVAQLLDGSGLFNTGLSVVLLCQSLGATMSLALAGSIVVHSSFSAAFASLGAIAGIALLCFIIGPKDCTPSTL